MLIPAKRCENNYITFQNILSFQAVIYLFIPLHKYIYTLIQIYSVKISLNTMNGEEFHNFNKNIPFIYNYRRNKKKKPEREHKEAFP